MHIKGIEDIGDDKKDVKIINIITKEGITSSFIVVVLITDNGLFNKK